MYVHPETYISTKKFKRINYKRYIGFGVEDREGKRNPMEW